MKLNQLRKRANEKGFTLIELMIVVAIIGILAAIAIPNFLGMQEKAKRRSIEEAATSAKADLHNWINATMKQELGVIDHNGDGLVGNTEAPPPMVSLPTIARSWVNAFSLKKGGVLPKSPWFAKKLYTIDVAPPHTGLILYSTVSGGRGIIIRGYDKTGQVTYEDSVSVD